MIVLCMATDKHGNTRLVTVTQGISARKKKEKMTSPGTDCNIVCTTICNPGKEVML